MHVTALFIALVLGYTYAQGPFCDYTKYVQLGSKYYIYSPNYPQGYPQGIRCRWQVACPTGTYCRLKCRDIDVPQSQSCYLDRFLVSRTGDPQLVQAQYYCGRGTLTVASIGQRISVGLISGRYSPGGRIYCEVEAVLRSPPTTPPPAPLAV